MPYTTLVVFTAGATLPAADLNSNFANSDYLRYSVNAQFVINNWVPNITEPAGLSGTIQMTTNTNRNYQFTDFADTGGATRASAFFPLPSDYNGGTVTAKFYWTANSTSTNSVYWLIAAASIADNESLDAAHGAGVFVTDAHNGAAYKLNITASTSAITIGGTPAANELVSWVVIRSSGDASDTLAATARLLSVVISYTRT